MDLVNKYINNKNHIIRTTYIFETLVLNALQEYLQKENKRLISSEYGNEENNLSFHEFDGVILEGIDELEGQTVIEIKLYSDKSSYQRNSKKIAEVLSKKLELFPNMKSILFIFGHKFLDEEKEKLEERFQSLLKHAVKIWDIKDLCKIDSQFNSFSINDLSKVTEILVNNAVDKSLSKSSGDWKKIRQERLEELKNSYKRDELVLFLGAGVSKDAGISEWKDLISDLLVLMIKNKFSKKNRSINDFEADFILKELNENSPLLQATFIKAGLGESFEKDVSRFLYKNFNDTNKGTSKLLKSISKLCLPRRNGVGIRAVVTYNFDDLLEVNLKEYNIHYHSLYSEMDYTTPDELGIYHVHGFLPRNPEEYEQLSEGLLVFSEDGYHNLYNDPYSWANITQLNFLRENTTLMIGLSLNDPNLRRLLAISNRRTKASKHFAIMKKNNFSNTLGVEEIRDDILESFNIVNNELQEKFFEQLGMKIIWVEKYEEIPELLESIKRI